MKWRIAASLILMTASAGAITTNAAANSADAGWSSTGVQTYDTSVSVRIGSQGSPTNSALVIPFWIPALNGMKVADAKLSLTIPTNAGLAYATGLANADVYGVRTSSSPTTVAGDYSNGTLVVDNWFNIRSNLTIGTKTATNSTLASWIDSQVGTNGGAYIFLTVRPDALDGTYRYATVNTANAATNRPTLYLKFMSEVSTNELAVDVNSAVNGPGTNWATAFQTISGAVASSKFSATNRNVIRVKEGVYREKITINKSGVSGRPLMLMSATAEDKAVISGMKQLPGWSLSSGTIYTNTEMGTNLVSDIYINNIKMQKARLPNSGLWAATSTTSVSNPAGRLVTITDTNRLLGLTNDLTGASVVAWKLLNNIFIESRVVSFNPAAGQVSFIGDVANWSTIGGTLFYALVNQKSLIDQPGEWCVVTGAVNTVYMKSLDGNAPAGVESPFLAGSLIYISSQGHIRLDGLELSGAASGQHNVNVYKADDIGIYNCISHDAGNYGISIRSVDNVDVANNIIRDNWFGLVVQDSTNTTVRCNDIGYNKEDSFRIVGGGGASVNIQVSSNYIHHTATWGHSDTMQIFGTDGATGSYPSNLTFNGNLIFGGGQTVMSAATVNNTYRNNMLVGSEATMLIFGHGTAGFQSVIDNTLACARYGNLSLTWRDYIVQSNIFFTGNSQPLYSTQYCTNYTGDYNWFYPAPRETNQVLLMATNYTTHVIESCRTLAAFQSVTGQDINSTVGNPGFSNAPVGILSIDETKMEKMTTNSFILNLTPRISVGDLFEYNFDGVMRTVTSIPAANTIVFTPALAKVPERGHILLIWGTNTNNVLDLRTSVTTRGSSVSIPNYQAGDFNGDGVRDIPQLPAYLE